MKTNFSLMSDASSLTTTDVRLPTLVHIAVEKLLGWSVVVDVFHGHGEPIAVSIREAVRDIAPYLNRLVHQSAVTETVGMEQVCRVMFVSGALAERIFHELGRQSGRRRHRIPSAGHGHRPGTDGAGWRPRLP